MMDTLRLYLCWKHDISMLSNRYSILKAIGDALYFTITDLFQIILFLRFYLIFRTSIYSLKKLTLSFFISQFIISFIFNSVNTTLISLGSHYEELRLLSIYVMIILNGFVISITLIILFIYKLQNLYTIMAMGINQQLNVSNSWDPLLTKTSQSPDIEQTIHGSINRSDLIIAPRKSSTRQTQTVLTMASFKAESFHPSHSMHANMKNNINILIVMTRYAVLYTFAICFNAIYYTMILLQFVCDGFLSDDKLDGIVLYASRSVGIIGIALCVLLGTQFANKAYSKLCWCCHLSCFKCFHKRNKK